MFLIFLDVNIWIIRYRFYYPNLLFVTTYCWDSIRITYVFFLVLSWYIWSYAIFWGTPPLSPCDIWWSFGDLPLPPKRITLFSTFAKITNVTYIIYHICKCKGREGGKENCGLFPLFVTFFNLIGPLSITKISWEICKYMITLYLTTP